MYEYLLFELKIFSIKSIIIISISFILIFITLSNFNKIPNKFKSLCLCIIGGYFLLFFILFFSYIIIEKKSYNTKHYGNKNIIEYAEAIKLLYSENRFSKFNPDIIFEHSIPYMRIATYGVTKTSVILKAKPNGDEYGFIIIPPDEKLKLVDAIYHKNPYRIKANYIYVSYYDSLGWVNGSYIEPNLTVGPDWMPIVNTIRLISRLAFPETTIKGKVFGVLIGLVISVFFGLLLYRFTIKSRNMWLFINISQFLLIALYFFIKNFNSMILHSHEHLIIFFLVYIFILPLPIFYLSNQIEKIIIGN